MFLDHAREAIEIYRECPRPNNIELHDEEAFSEWIDMARAYKPDNRIIQFVSESDQWEAWYRYAVYIIEGEDED